MKFYDPLQSLVESDLCVTTLSFDFVLRSETFLAMMTCWGTHRCQEARPQPAGPCAAVSIDEGDQGITTLDMVTGEWWGHFVKCAIYTLSCPGGLSEVGIVVVGLHLPHVNTGTSSPAQAPPP